jgi:hypothetical protein
MKYPCSTQSQNPTPSIPHHLLLCPPIQPIHINIHSPILNRKAIAIPERSSIAITQSPRKGTLVLMSSPLSIIPSVCIPIHAIVLELTVHLLGKHRQADCTIMLAARWSKQTIVDLCAAVVIAVLEAVHAAYARGLLVAHSLALLGDVELDAGGEVVP